jgi:hypothetical protein
MMRSRSILASILWLLIAIAMAASLTPNVTICMRA